MPDHPHDLVTRALEAAGWRPDADRPDMYRTAHHPPVVVPLDPDAPDYREMLADLVPALCHQVEWTQAKRRHAEILLGANGDLSRGHARRMREAQAEAERYRLAWLSARRRAADAECRRPSVDELIGVFGPRWTGGLCSVCFVRVQRGKDVDPEHEKCQQASLTEEGRRLASRRDDLIADGADPSELEIPIAPNGDTDA